MSGAGIAAVVLLGIITVASLLLVWYVLKPRWEREGAGEVLEMGGPGGVGQ